MDRLVPALDAVDRIEHRCGNERRIATANLGTDPRVTQGHEHVLVPIGHFIGSDRAGQGQRQCQERQTTVLGACK